MSNYASTPAARLQAFLPIAAVWATLALTATTAGAAQVGGPGFVVTSDSSSSATERTVHRNTLGGREVHILTYTKHHRDCGQGSQPIVTILTQPAHGSVSVRTNSVVAGHSRFSSPDCSGQTYEGQGIWYVPAAGFSGSDKFDYTVDLGNGIAHDTAIINVTP